VPGFPEGQKASVAVLSVHKVILLLTTPSTCIPLHATYSRAKYTRSFAERAGPPTTIRSTWYGSYCLAHGRGTPKSHGSPHFALGSLQPCSPLLKQEYSYH